MSAMRFSNPSPRLLENGRLFGSAQTRKAATAPGGSGGATAPIAAIAAATRIATTIGGLETKDIESAVSQFIRATYVVVTECSIGDIQQLRCHGREDDSIC